MKHHVHDEQKTMHAVISELQAEKAPATPWSAAWEAGIKLELVTRITKK